jgi:threonine/homoserine/homoserine lactone efflux protein
MSATAIFFSILGALLIGAISPGPSFVLVSRIAVTASRLDGLAAALGMGLGGAIFGTLALVGLTALLLQVEWLHFILKIVGGAYLVYLGVRMWQGASEPLASSEVVSFQSKSRFRSFFLALLTHISNPKAAVFYGSIFAALLPASPPMWLLLVLPPSIFLIEAGWYAVVALLFSSKRPRAIYLGSKNWIDRLAGAVMGALGVRLISESVVSPKP